MKEVLRKIGLLLCCLLIWMGACGILLAVVLLFGGHFHWLLMAIFAIGIPIAVIANRSRGKDAATLVQQSESEETTTAAPMSSEPKAELQPAPDGAKKEVRTTMPTSNHPLAGKTSKFRAVVGFLIDLGIAYVLYTILVGKFALTPPAGFAFFGLTYPWEALATLAALGFFILDTATSRRRPRTGGWATLDLLGTIAIGLVLIGAALSMYPPIAASYRGLGLNVAAYSSINVSIVAFFSVATLAHFRKWHLKRADVGLEAVEGGQVQQGLNLEQSGGLGNLAVFQLTAPVTIVPHQPGFEVRYEYVPVLPKRPALVQTA